MRGIALIVVVALANPAEAGRTVYGWLPATETVPDGALAIESSVFERDDLGDTHERADVLVLAPVIGVSDRLELALPIELASITATDVAPGVYFTRLGIEGRYRFAERDASLVPLVRAAVFRDTVIRTGVRIEAEVGVTYQRDRLHVELAAGIASDFNIGHFHNEYRLGAGASFRVRRCLRLGGELHAEVTRDSIGTTWAALGPTLAWSHRRFWLSGALDLGIHNITAAPRLSWGMAW
jgi:hypothetical protein